MKNGEEVCEGHGFTETECMAIGCCQWDDACHSNVGRGECMPPKDHGDKHDDGKKEENMCHVEDTGKGQCGDEDFYNAGYACWADGKFVPDEAWKHGKTCGAWDPNSECA